MLLGRDAVVVGNVTRAGVGLRGVYLVDTGPCLNCDGLMVVSMVAVLHRLVVLGRDRDPLRLLPPRLHSRPL